MTTWLNIMGFDATQLSRWDRLDGAAAVEALAGALRAAGLPDGQLEAPMRLLAQAEDLAGQARAAKDAARQRLEQANRALLADGPDLARCGATLGELAPWLDEESAGMIGVMQAAARIRSNATQVTFALVPSCAVVLGSSNSRHGKGHEPRIRAVRQRRLGTIELLVCSRTATSFSRRIGTSGSTCAAYASVMWPR